MPPSNDSVLKLFALLPAEDQKILLAETARQARLSPAELQQLLVADWRITGRPKQQAPVDPWTYWFILAGRGFGKTISGANWARKKGLAAPCRVALIAPTQGDVRDTMVEGETGILSVLRPDELLGGTRDTAWNRSLLQLTLSNGTFYKGFSSEQPDRLRGPAHHYVWGEEVSSWNDASRGDALNTTWSNAKLGCRLGDRPQYCLTSTPKPNKLTTQLLSIPAPQMRLVTGSSYENRDNLSDEWWQMVVAPLEGTRTGLQEIYAQLLDDVEGALWTRKQLDALRIEPGSEPTMKRIVVAVDPQGSTDEASNEAGIIVIGIGHDRKGYVLDDRTPRERGPWAWGRAAVDAYHDWKADRLVAETNFGAAMVEYVIKSVDPTVAFKEVHASRGKRVRAEPVATLYEGERARMHHVGVFPELETEMVTWTPDAESPNRLDALVWGATELKLWQPVGKVRVQATREQIPVHRELYRGF